MPGQLWGRLGVWDEWPIWLQLVTGLLSDVSQDRKHRCHTNTSCNENQVFESIAALCWGSEWPADTKFEVQASCCIALVTGSNLEELIRPISTSSDVEYECRVPRGTCDSKRVPFTVCN